MKIVNTTAKKGEELAARYLHEKGYKVIDRNFRKGYGEIDIVAIDCSGKERILTFVEVKTRKQDSFGEPLEAITFWKLKSLIQTAKFYKLINPTLPNAMRIDAMSVVLTNDNRLEKIEHIKNISGF